MAKPTKVPTWATDADYSNGPEVGTPTKADPGAGVQAEGYIPQTRLAAQVINWWQNLVGQWTSWLDSTFAGGDGDPIEFLEPLDSVHSLGDVGTGGEFLYVDASGAPAPKTLTAFVHGAELLPETHTTPYARTSGGGAPPDVFLVSNANAAWFNVANARRIIPSNATITKITAYVTPGAARATAANRTLLYFRRVGFTGTTENDDGTTTAQQQLVISGLSVPGGEVLTIAVRTGADSNEDIFTGIEIEYTLPGPPY